MDNKKPTVNLDNQLVKINNQNTVKASEFLEALKTVDEKVVLAIITEAAKLVRSDDLRFMATITEIMNTESFIQDEPRVKKIKELSGTFNLGWWLKEKGGILNRQTIIGWWNAFGHLLVAEGIETHGISPNDPGAMNLWKATRSLASKMSEESARYGYLQPYNVNDPRLVEKALSEITDPYAWIEVLVGEAWEDICQCPELLKAFTTVKATDEENDISPQQGVIATISIALS